LHINNIKKMTDSITSEMQFNEAKPAQKEKGLLGWVSFNVFDMFRFNALAVKQSREGVASLSYPANTSAAGKQYHYIRPLNDSVRLKVEAEVLGQLGYRTEEEDQEE